MRKGKHKHDSGLKPKNDAKESQACDSAKTEKDDGTGNSTLVKKVKNTAILWALRILWVAVFLTLLVSVIFYYKGRDLSPAIDWISLGFISLGLVAVAVESCLINKGWRNPKKKKEECKFLSKEQCPYSTIKDCPYDSRHCTVHRTRKKNRWKLNILWIIFLFSVLLYFGLPYLDDVLNHVFDLDLELDCSSVTSICMSIIVACLLAILVDMPGRMKEYQDYFVELLASDEYLKHMSEGDLSQLRQRITRVQHSKDVRSMPKGLIKFDELVCEMLRSPFYKDYTQITTVNDIPDRGLWEKKVHVSSLAFNPYKNDKPVCMDIGFNHSIVVAPPKDGDWENLGSEIREYFTIDNFTVMFGDNVTEKYDLKEYIKVIYRDAEREGSDYNCLIYVLLDLERLPVLCLESLKYNRCAGKKDKGNNKKAEMKTEYRPNVEKDNLIIQFLDKIQITLDYTLKVPRKDITYTKSLRYPVQHFSLDYSLGKGMDGYRLTGQLMSSMLEYPNTSVNLSNEGKSISLRTSSWLLPKNGAIIVHQKNEEK